MRSRRQGRAWEDSSGMGADPSCAGAGPLARCPPVFVVGPDRTALERVVQGATINEPACTVADGAGQLAALRPLPQGPGRRMAPRRCLLEREPAAPRRCLLEREPAR